MSLCLAPQQPHLHAPVSARAPQGKLELRSWRDEEKLARDRSRKRVMGSANEEPAEEETDGSDQVQRPSKIHVTTRDLNDRELEDRESKRKELMPLAE